MIKLFAPKQSRVGLVNNIALGRRQFSGVNRIKKFLRLRDPFRKKSVNSGRSGRSWRFVLGIQSQPDKSRFTRWDGQHVVRRGFGSVAARVDRGGAAANDIFVKGVLGKWRGISKPKEPRIVRLIIGEEHGRNPGVRIGTDLEKKASERLVLQSQQIVSFAIDAGSERATFVRATPDPGVTEPDRRQQMQRGHFGAAVDHANSDENVVRRIFSIFRKDIEVTRLIKRSAVFEFEFGLTPAAAAIFLD